MIVGMSQIQFGQAYTSPLNGRIHASSISESNAEVASSSSLYTHDVRIYRSFIGLFLKLILFEQVDNLTTSLQGYQADAELFSLSTNGGWDLRIASRTLA